MPADSPIAAVMEKFDTLDQSLMPGGDVRIWFDQPPQYDGGQVQPGRGYVVLQDGGTTTDLTFEDDAIEPGQLSMFVFADTLADVDAVVKVMRWNGQPPNARAGFDCGSLELNPPFEHLEMVHLSERRSVAGVGKSGQRVHQCVVGYRLKTQVVAGEQP